MSLTIAKEVGNGLLGHSVFDPGALINPVPTVGKALAAHGSEESLDSIRIKNL